MGGMAGRWLPLASGGGLPILAYLVVLAGWHGMAGWSGRSGRGGREGRESVPGMPGWYMHTPPGILA